MTASSDRKNDHARDAFPKQLTQAALDKQAEIIRLIAIQKYFDDYGIPTEISGNPAFKSSRTTCSTSDV
jgi:hypothetical protein